MSGMCANRGSGAPSARYNSDVFRRVREMVFAANDVRNLHLDVVNHIDEMKDPRTIGTANGHVGMRPGIR